MFAVDRQGRDFSNMGLVLCVVWVVLASLAGIALSAGLPWSESARRVSLHMTAGLALGPLLAGLVAVAVLWLMPGAQHASHAGVALAALALPAWAGWRQVRGIRLAAAGRHRRMAWAGALALVAYAGALLFDVAVVPLIQNDALEYATVARDLYSARTLEAYPAINPALTRSGFFGPWTHPPTYVALMYLADVFQGGAESAIALRLISPWCLLAAAACVASLGALRSAAASLLAAVIFISTPILFLGASSALIDPLPVMGMTLGFAALVGLRLDRSAGAAGLGLLLGLALWTHSQAILFPCLLLPALWWMAPAAPGRVVEALQRRIVRALKPALTALGVCILVGGAPYLRNLRFFGSLISDNPEVFAYGPLQFAEYFRLQRGISDPVEIIQYGVFKGFFAPEAYSFAFWLALAGVPAALALLWRLRRSGLDAVDAGSRVAAGALVVWCLYLAAAALSAGIGVDLMIRNERYLLVLMPCIALLAAAGLTRLPGAAPAGLVRRTVLVLLFALVPLQLAVLVSYRQTQLRGDMVAWNEQAQARRWPPFLVVDHLREKSPTTSVVFSMKPADMFYADRKMLSYLDPRSIPFYTAADELQALRWLNEQGISHVHMPDYFLPPIYMSRLMGLLADPRYSSLEIEAKGYQTYALRDATALPSALARRVLPMASSWELQSQLVLGGRKSLMRITLDRQPHVLGRETINRGFLGFFYRDSARVLVSKPVDVATAMASCPGGAARAEILADVQFRGSAHVQLLAVFTDASGRLIERRALGDRPALGRGQPTAIVRRGLMPNQTTHVALMVEHSGVSRVTLDAAGMQVLCGA